MSIKPHFDQGPSDGLHRVRLTGSGPAEGWPPSLERFRRDLADALLRAGWLPKFSLHWVGWEPTSSGVLVYLAGNLLAWRGFAATDGVPNPILEHLGRGLERAGVRLQELHVESRSFEPRAHDLGQERPWPFTWDRLPATAQRLALEGAVSPAQAEGLVEYVAAVERTEAWAQGELPADARPRWHGGELELTRAVHAGWLVEAVNAWAQAWWVTLTRVRLT
jgi:hypothetical protein